MIHNITAYDDPPRDSYEVTVIPLECPATIGDYCPLFLVDEINSLRRAASGAILLNFRGLEVILPRRALMDRYWIAQNILDLVIDPKDTDKQHVGSHVRCNTHPRIRALFGEQQAVWPERESPASRPEWSFVFNSPVIYFDPHGVLAEPPQCATSSICTPATPILVDEI